MKTLTNRMGSVVTGDVLADAVVAYHDALVARRNVDLVELPVLIERNLVRRASIAIGWLTELVSHPVPLTGRELVDTVTADSLRARADQMRATGTGGSLDFD